MAGGPLHALLAFAVGAPSHRLRYRKKMAVFFLRRLPGLLLVLWIVVTATFFLVLSIPGGPFDAERQLPESVEAALKAKYNLDGTRWEQYGSYMGKLIQGDLGDSLKYKSLTVNEILAQTLPVSFTLGALALVIAATMGVWLGSLAAVHKHSWIDLGAMLTALAAISIPTFITGPALVLVFGIWLKWFPVGGWDTAASVILPAICLALPYTAYIARLQRTSMLETLGEDFVRTARAKGLDEGRVIYAHALKVAILPIVSYLGPLAANLMTGSIVVEMVFGLPGAGRFFILAVQNRDYFLLSGVVIVYCTLVVVFNMLVDQAYTVLDKRIKLNA